MPAKGPFLTPKKPMPIGRGRGRGKGPVTPGPVKPKPSKGKNPQLPYRSADPGFGPKKKRNPGKGNPPVDKTLPRRYDPGFGGPKKRPQPVKPKPKGGIRDLLYRAKPGEQMKKNFKSTTAKGFDKAKYEQMIQSGAISIMRPFNKLNNEKSRKDTSPMKRPTPIKIDKVKMAEESYKNYLKQRNEKIRKAEGGVLKGMEKLKNTPRNLQSMLKGYGKAKPDNSSVTYKTRVKPKGFQRVMDAPYRIKNTTVKTGRGR